MKKETFFKFLEYLQIKYDECHKKGGKKGLSVICKLVLAVTYWREYRPMRQMSLDYDVPKSTVCDSIKWVEINLEKWEKIKLEDIKTEIQKAKSLGIEFEEIIGDGFMSSFWTHFFTHLNTMLNLQYNYYTFD